MNLVIHAHAENPSLEVLKKIQKYGNQECRLWLAIEGTNNPPRWAVIQAHRTEHSANSIWLIDGQNLRWQLSQEELGAATFLYQPRKQAGVGILKDKAQSEF